MCCEAGLSPVVSTGDPPWKDNPSDEDPVRPSADTTAADATEPSNTGEARREDKSGEERGKGKDDKETVGEGIEDDAEIRRPKVGRIPKAPTKRELEEHLPLHMPYKAWCPICVAGEGIHNQSRAAKGEEKERIGVTISLDYCFLTSEGEAEEDPKVVIMHDDRLETFWALGVQRKGVTSETVTWITQKLEEAGYKGVDLTLKTDQEEAIMALKRAVAARREAVTAMVESKVRVSVSNPRVERAVRKWRGQFRKMKKHLEAKIKKKIPPDHPMVPWLVTWAGEVIQK